MQCSIRLYEKILHHFLPVCRVICYALASLWQNGENKVNHGAIRERKEFLGKANMREDPNIEKQLS